MLFRISSLIAAAWLVASSSGAPDPSEYFGGTNNEAYLAWVDTLGDKTSHAFIPTSWDPTKGAALHWAITDDGYIDLAVAVQASGWMGVGFSPVGGMTGSDVFLVEAANPGVVTDAYVLSDRVMPQEDTQQDWEMTAGNAILDSGFMMVQVRRLLDTLDTQDHALLNDSDVSFPVSHVITAWGNDTSVGYHGKSTARSAIRWFSQGMPESEVFQSRMSEKATGSALLGAKDYPVKVQETEYAYFCFNSADLEALGNFSMETGVNVIGIDAVVDNARHVHHFILYGNTQDFTRTDNFTCRIGENGFMGEVAYVWAPGEPGFVFPDNVGVAVGDANDIGAFRSFMLEIHYDNSDLLQNQTDSSGVKLYFTTEPREFKAGILAVGDPSVRLRNTSSITPGLSDWQFSCPGSCSSLSLPDGESVTVLREYLHMHHEGYYISNEQRRNGEVIRTSKIEFWDFDQNGNPPVQQEPFEILPGDSFNVRCNYLNKNDFNASFGMGSKEEMCIAFLLYYPRKTLPLSDFEIPWVCGVGFTDFGLPECDVSIKTEFGVEPVKIFGSATPDSGDGGEDNPGPTSSTSRVGVREGVVVASCIALLVFTVLA